MLDKPERPAESPAPIPKEFNPAPAAKGEKLPHNQTPQEIEELQKVAVFKVRLWKLGFIAGEHISKERWLEALRKAK